MPPSSSLSSPFSPLLTSPLLSLAGMPTSMLPSDRHMGFSSAESLGRLLTLLLWKFWRVCGAAILILILVYWMYGGIIILILLVVTVIGGLYHYQDSLLYYPEQPESARVFVQTPISLGLPYENVSLTTKDGCRIVGYFIKQPPTSIGHAPTVLYFHGNAGNIGHRLHNAQALYRHCGFNIFLLEYRGYGKSQGTPSEFGECRFLSPFPLSLTPSFSFLLPLFLPPLFLLSLLSFSLSFLLSLLAFSLSFLLSLLSFSLSFLLSFLSLFPHVYRLLLFILLKRQCLK